MYASRVFDAHLHIIDSRFPLVENNGYLPGTFTCEDYLDKMRSYDLVGGAVVSGSFQAFDQTYLVDALDRLGPSFVGVAQVPAAITDDRLIELDRAGVRGARLNLKRGGSVGVQYIDAFAKRVYELVGWHVELYVDAKKLPTLLPVLIELPAVSIDHLGLARESFATLLKLVENGVHVKATGFGRLDFNVGDALKALFAANPDALMFGTDLPSTRAPRSYQDKDFSLISGVLGAGNAEKVLYKNAASFYRLADAG